jgi:hypothetical protein
VMDFDKVRRTTVGDPKYPGSQAVFVSASDFDACHAALKETRRALENQFACADEGTKDALIEESLSEARTELAHEARGWSLRWPTEPAKGG